MSHTPGPWVITACDPMFECRRIFAGSILVAAVGRSDASEEQQDADALLIAAAPDMLEALQLCAKLFGDVLADDVPSASRVASVVSQTIAKAEGKP